jgi:hypothetical protein
MFEAVACGGHADGKQRLADGMAQAETIAAYLFPDSKQLALSDRQPAAAIRQDQEGKKELVSRGVALQRRIQGSVRTGNR